MEFKEIIYVFNFHSQDLHLGIFKCQLTQETVKWNTSGGEGMQLFDSHHFTATPTKVAPQTVACGHR